MPKQQQLVYLSDEQFQTLVAQGSITVNGQTVEYSEDDIYVTPQKDAYIKPATGIPASDLADNAVPVKDVQVNGSSVLQNGIANVPVANASAPGVAKVVPNNGITIVNGALTVYAPGDQELRQGANAYRPVTPNKQHASTFYGLAKAAGDTTQAQSSNEVGTYTPEAKGAIQTMLGANTMIAPNENDLVADRDYAVGDLFTANGKVYKATAEILTGTAIVATGNNTNCEETSVANAFVKNTDYATTSEYGIIKIGSGLWTNSDGFTTIDPANSTFIKTGAGQRWPITPLYQHESTFYGLAKAAGDTTQSRSSNAVGNYTDEAKTAICSMIGAVNISQVPTEETAQDLLASVTTDAGLNDIFLTVLGWYIDNLPQNESAQDIVDALKLEADRLEQIYDLWIAEKEGA